MQQLFILALATGAAPPAAAGEQEQIFEQVAGARKVLVTGAAGFIGFHTVAALHEQGDAVIGLDSFNHYYDVRLKFTRAELLRRLGVTPLFEGSVCDGLLLHRLLSTGVTHVIHLAAQAGVRYSLDHPLEYIEANVECFVTLLEAVRSYNSSIPITYASSSSVYGNNKKIPFSETDRVDDQASLYGATKKADESIANVYHSLHKLKLTGLRFFTVYGPLGRPDMAYFSFTNDLLRRRQIIEYRQEDGTELERDFTHVSDIVKGIIAASRRASENEIFNLGNTHPAKVSSLIRIIEQGLGVIANVTQKPIAAGDVPVTYANVSHAHALLDFSPTVQLEDGLRGFLQWYAAYYNVALPSSMAPTPAEAEVLRRLYGINDAEEETLKAEGAADGSPMTPTSLTHAAATALWGTGAVDGVEMLSSSLPAAIKKNGPAQASLQPSNDLVPPT